MPTTTTLHTGSFQPFRPDLRVPPVQRSGILSEPEVQLHLPGSVHACGGKLHAQREHGLLRQPQHGPFRRL